MQKYFIFQRGLQCLNDRLAVTIRKYSQTRPADYCKFYSSNARLYKKKTAITNIDDLIRFIKDKRTFYLKLLTNIHNTVDYSKINPEDAQLLLNCCGDSLADSSQNSRNEACQKIYRELLNKNNLNLNIYHTYIKVCSDNSVKLNIKEFLSNMNYEPIQQTYKLLLKNVSEQGDIQQVYEILEIMKEKGLKIDEDIFNDVVLAHTINGGLKSSNAVLETMRIAQISETTNTKFAILKGIIKRGNKEELNIFLQQFDMNVNEPQLLNIILELGLSGNVSWLSDVHNLYSGTSLSRDFIISLKQKCVHLVHMNKPEAAWDIFQYFVKSLDDVGDDYGFFILREMLFCRTNIDKIINIAKHLKEQQLNVFALEKLTDICLRHMFVDEAWQLLNTLPVLRPHFFWPLLVEAYNQQGEGGVFKTITKIRSLQVKLDNETLKNFILPFCNLDDPKFLVTRLKNEGCTVKEILEPLFLVLLHKNKTKEAVDLFASYNVELFGNDWFHYLPFSWSYTKDTHRTVILLQKICESNANSNNIVGAFLTKTLGLCKEPKDYNNFIKLLELIKESRLRIDPAAAENLRNSIPKDYSQQITENINLLIDFGTKSESSTIYISHPRDMNLEELECHLLELKEKKMNIRGTLRLLIMQHIKHGNLERVQELRQEFIDQGYEESTGMKSALMHTFILKGHLQPALTIYNELCQSDPTFKIDTFKIIDLCTLLVKENNFQTAMEILQKESKSRNIKPTKDILRNCLELLNAFKNVTEQAEMFEFLTNTGYCSVNNILLGPLIRIHLNDKCLDKAVEAYVNFTEKYRCTPLQLELFKEVVKLKDKPLLQTLFQSTKKIHGTIPTQVALIAALAETGTQIPLNKLLLTLKTTIQKEMQKRCDKWVMEQKIDPLLTLVDSCVTLKLSPHIFDLNYAVKCVIKLYSASDDCESVIRFYQMYQEKQLFNKELEEQLQKITKHNKFVINASIST